MIDNLKNFLSNNKKIIFNAVFHAGLMLISLVLSYNTYKEYLKWSFDIFPVELKIAIKATFPLAIFVFLTLYILQSIWRGRKNESLSLNQYIIIFLLQAIIINIIFFSKGIDILIALNLALLYFAVFILIWAVIKRVIVVDAVIWSEELLPPIIYRYLHRNMPRIRAYLKQKPSALFIIGFMFLLIICAILLILKLERIAEELANIAYFSLVIGVGIEVYKMIKYGEGN